MPVPRFDLSPAELETFAPEVREPADFDAFWNGKLKALAISTAKRSPLYPQVPTVAESGLPGYQADAWYGVLLRRLASRGWLPVPEE